MKPWIRDKIKQNTEFDFYSLTESQLSFCEYIEVEDNSWGLKIYVSPLGELQIRRAIILALFDPLLFNLAFQDWQDKQTEGSNEKV